MNFNNQILGLTGLDSISSGDVTQFLNDGIKEVTDRVVGLQPRKANLFMSEVELSASPSSIDIESGLVLNVWRENGTALQYEAATQIPPELRWRVTDTESLHYRSKFNPGWYMTGKTLNVVPITTDSSGEKAKIQFVDYATTSYTDSSIYNGSSTLTAVTCEADDGVFTKSGHGLVVGDTVTLSGFLQVSDNASYDTINGMTTQVATVPDANTFTVEGVIAATISTDLDEGTVQRIGVNFPDQYEKAVVLYAGIKTLQQALVTISNTTPSDLGEIVLLDHNTSVPVFTVPAPFVAPAEITSTLSADIASAGNLVDYKIPALPVLDNFAVPSFSISAVPPIPPTSHDTTVTLPTTLPLYVRPTCTLPALPVIDNLEVTVTAPVLPADVLATVTDASADAPSYTAPVLNITASPDITALTITATPPAAPSNIADVTTGSVTVGSFGTAPNFIEPFMSLPDWNDTDNWISVEEDNEMLAARVQEIQAKIGEYGSKLQNASAKFQEGVTEYQATIQKEMSEAQMEAAEKGKNADLKMANQASRMQNYQAQLGQFQAEVQKEVDEWQRNCDKQLKIWNQQRQTELGQYQADLQNSINEFNKENVIYQQHFQAATASAGFIDKQSTRLVQRYQAQLGEYGAEVNKQVQEFSSNQTKNITLWQQEAQQNLTKYQADMGNSNNKFTEEMAVYQAGIQKAIKDADLEAHKHADELKVFATEIQSYSALVQKEVQEYNVKLQNDIVVWDKKRAHALQDYSNQVQGNTAEVSTSLSNYQAKIAVAMQKETLNSVQSAAQKLTNAVQEYKSNLELETAKFSTAFQKYQVVSEDIVRKNSSLLQKYERDIQNYVSKLQNVTSKYTWMEGRMLKLQGEYDAIFGLIAPPPPPKKEERGR